MRGLEIAKAFYHEYGEPMLREKFPEILPFMAVGLLGRGSECLGFDDEVSRDHDFEPGFCVFLPGEEIVDRRTAFLLERAYAGLPKEFMGLRRAVISPVGGARHGVLRTAEFMTDLVGSSDGRLDLTGWMTVPDHALTEALSGEIFTDPYGEVTAIRERLRRQPVDVKRKKLAGHLLLMGQSGQYNYKRCLAHGETAAAQLAVTEFVKSTMSVVFLLNNTYQPYYKWSFRAMRALPRLSLEAELLEYLLTSDNEPETAKEKYDVIEGIASDVIDELMEQGLTEAICADLEKHAYSVNDQIADAYIRNLHILAAV
jgi:hypothetical protein